MMKPDMIDSEVPNWRELVRGALASITEFFFKPKRSHETAFYCSADWHLVKLGKHAALVHALMLRVQKEDRDFYGSKGNIEEYFDADEKSIRKAIRSLVDSGFVEEIQTRDGQSTIRRALNHKEWAGRNPGRCTVKRDKNNPSQKMAGVDVEPMPNFPSPPCQETAPPRSQIFPLPPVKNGSQVSELVSEEVSEKSPKGSGGRENASHSHAAISSPSLLQQTEPEPSSQENTRRLWAHRIWTAKTSKPLNVRKTDLARLERFITENGEDKAARAWWEYVNAEPCPYHLEPVEIAIKRQGKNGKEWLEGAEDASKVTTFPLAAFFAVAQGYLVAAETPLDSYYLPKFQKQYGKQRGVVSA